MWFEKYKLGILLSLFVSVFVCGWMVDWIIWREAESQTEWFGFGEGEEEENQLVLVASGFLQRSDVHLPLLPPVCNVERVKYSKVFCCMGYLHLTLFNLVSHEDSSCLSLNTGET